MYHRPQEAAHRSDAIVYSIYYVDTSVYGGSGGGEGELRRISDETGGRVFHIDRRYTLEDAFKGNQATIRVPSWGACEPCQGSGAAGGRVRRAASITKRG